LVRVPVVWLLRNVCKMVGMCACCLVTEKCLQNGGYVCLLSG